MSSLADSSFHTAIVVAQDVLYSQFRCPSRPLLPSDAYPALLPALVSPRPSHVPSQDPRLRPPQHGSSPSGPSSISANFNSRCPSVPPACITPQSDGARSTLTNRCIPAPPRTTGHVANGVSLLIARLFAHGLPPLSAAFSRLCRPPVIITA
ncbi:hypothetical protein K488DRAFT_86113 [Vararia minispora EC-137]|uniref:Uncharacterized protein n=1 Tax=Vararia minispora EC-137 TaxID=1314806 RepID=A0ACB8QKL1_9AGAM|nr:hypothetical protein K488DRAFT_86113 [Vararia minispora EC-137]